MSKTAERTRVKISGDFANGQARRPQTKADPFPIRCLKAAASLRITVVLMALSILLIFFGTLAQVDQGIGTVLHAYFRTWLAWIPWQVFVRFGQVFFRVSQSTQVSGSFPFPGGWLLGGLLLANLLAAHTVRFKVSWKRSGILVLHAGVVVMMLGELVTGLFAVEARMTIAVGETVSFTDMSAPPILGGSARELAITTESSESGKEHVTVIPASMLRVGKTIQDPQLPADVEVVEYMPNTELAMLRPEQPASQDVVTDNSGEQWALLPRAEENGVDSSGREDVPAVRVTLKRKGAQETLGTHLLSLWYYPNYTVRRLAFPPQQFKVDGKTYTISLRPTRTYKDFGLQLVDFRHKLYPGTNVPKDFQSTVKIKNASTGEDRKAEIYMNNPLDYGGETFYQSSYFPDDSGTVLQVVHNPGSLMPYLACGLVALGMLVHFGIHLVGFLRRTVQGLTSVWAQPATIWTWLVPIGVSAAFVLYLCVVMVPSGSPGKMHLGEAGKIPVQDGGRIKPLDAFARMSLLTISNRSTFVDEDKKEHSAMEWVLDAMSGGDPGQGMNRSAQYKIFRIENLQLLDLLGLKYRPNFYRYSFEEIMGLGDEQRRSKSEALKIEAARAEKMDEKKRGVFETKVLELWNHLELYYNICQLAAPAFIPAENPEDKWGFLADVKQKIDNTALMNVGEALQKQGHNRAQLAQLPKAQAMAIIQPVLQQQMRKARQQAGPPAEALLEMTDSYDKKETADFNKAVASYLAYLDESPSCDMARVRTEAFFDRVEPFYQCIGLFIVVFAVGCIGMLISASSPQAGRAVCRAAFWLALLTLLFQSWALITRMYIQDRPPVTNLYSAAVWISWGCVLLGLTLEGLFRNGIGNIVAAVPGCLSVFLAHHLAGSGDTLGMLQAVLDTNFWLATHVTIVTFGYVATIVAGVIGVIYVLLGVLTPALDRDMAKVLGQMIYGVLCFATLLSFTGTVLGGLWADYSWGRFWGWDPKENGALIIVLWNALILHARWAGLVKQRGVAVLSIVGIMVTGWSFIGTNQLGVGLHAYGFNNTLATILVCTWFTCLGLIIMGLSPRRLWISPPS
jgi:ABC-type transport system involved in cytochrome c biogenesis permease subunit